MNIKSINKNKNTYTNISVLLTSKCHFITTAKIKNTIGSIPKKVRANNKIKLLKKTPEKLLIVIIIPP